MNDKTLTGYLYQLARLYHVQTAYYDMAHRRWQASAESLLEVIKALGAPVASLEDAASAWRESRQELRKKRLEPVTVAWDGICPVIRVCLPESQAGGRWLGNLQSEEGRRQSWQWPSDDLPVLASTLVEGQRYLVKGINLPEKLPLGYHKFSLETPGGSGETLIISAPARAYLPPGGAGARQWGVFLPLYALPDRRRGSGDYSRLAELADWVAELGGKVVATLPLLPIFLDEPFNPCPYAPVSRLMWSEFYLDMERLPELALCPGAGELPPVPFQGGEKPRDLPLVDYRRLMAHKRRVLEECCRQLVNGESGRLRDFRRFIQEHPAVADYARFRAAREKQRVPWPEWPQALRDGTISPGDYDEAVNNYHLYAQWLAYQQVQALAAKARGQGMTLYFDLPLGVHPEGYDAWRERGIFTSGMSTGAPPDTVFTGGQDWGFPPLHPERIRGQGYRYVIDYLRHHLQQAGMLRVDHVMGLHRLFWIPKGMDAGRGVYVHYRAEELYAILALESQRHRCIIVGEDLGTVPAYVRPAMSRHGLQRMYVMHYELAGSPSCRPPKPPRECVASLNTHDMPTFAAFWQGRDIPERQRLGLLDAGAARVEKEARRACKKALLALLREKDLLPKAGAGTRDILRACLLLLSGSRARTVLVNLEDLWLETRTQNVPGTGDENHNWQHQARYALEEFRRMPEVRDILAKVNRLRKAAEK